MYDVSKSFVVTLCNFSFKSGVLTSSKLQKFKHKNN